ncbi:hypothetical protein SPRG_14597 [Saprolegnia parasitica CBS 223.65]|uniref:Uncharacterized protein n=1 Tax=Saprolegnia parasitica (strain CBS 223.65) TaxID=695850 RepID=A0A067BZY8_SAPPC|nr:hypothetical protein SPRG_14597 [Saprolegnia parasitica CBS 223.65]KDO20117.1 hypothetical protein SPRG_14597 [Saprolegnia parasitica CBS 223.65]|eukprot:XP_012209160.1 hypothetical protein SPRG_14597 [Saprolegnia parasitica CBS 223.65]
MPFMSSATLPTPVMGIGPMSHGVHYSKQRPRLDAFLRRLDVLIGFVIVLLVAIDSVANNWEINSFVGDGYAFLTPIATVSHAADLEAQYSFPRTSGLDDLSKIGFWMVNYTVHAMVTKSSDLYVLSVGSFPLSTSIDQCKIFKATYPHDVAASSTAHFGIASNTATYFRGNVFSHAFHSDATTNLPNASMNDGQLRDIGYVPGRTGTDMRLTTGVVVANVSTAQNLLVSWYKISPRSFCTGCTPVTELGYGQCNMTFVYNDTTKQVHISSSVNHFGSMYKVGVLLPQSGFSSASHYVNSMVDSIFAKILRTISPKYFPYPSLALRFDMFCYNSDLFVFLFAAGVLLDIGNCLMYLRVINLFNAPSPNMVYNIQQYALSTRLLWINCAVLKLLKILCNLVVTSTYNGENKIMRYLNLTNVTSLYISAIALMYVPPFIEYSNSVIHDLNHKVQNLDDIHVLAFDSFYLRVVPFIMALVVINLACVLLLDHTLYYKSWQLMAKNSLARQAIFNSSSILCDYLHGIEVDHDVDSKGSLLICKARRLSTLQWFFTSHLFCFGLPEKELRAKKKMLQTSSVTTTSEDSTSVKCMVVQDGDRHVHLLDAQLADVTPLVYNIKILKDTTVVIQ